VNEAGWNLFKVDWERYKRTCLPNQTDSELKDRLHYSCSSNLAEAIHNIQLPDPCSEADMLNAMKQMAVRKTNVTARRTGR
jgi:hypothetical protein